MPNPPEPLEEALSIARDHHRTLLLVQGERLRAGLLAADGDWPAADALFAETSKSASALGLPAGNCGGTGCLGPGRAQAFPASEQGRALIAAAREILAAHKAQADLALLPEDESTSGS